MNINGFGEYQPLRRSANKDIKAAAERAYQTPDSENTHAGEAAQGDAVTISPMARSLAQLRRMPDARADLVADLKAKLERGELEQPESLARGTAKMLSALLSDEI